MLDHSTYIGRVRIRAAASDPLAVQVRSHAALRLLELEPRGMPSRAILCIRALGDPLPGGIDARTTHASRPVAWEKAARDAIDGAYRRAVRPALGAVPAAADAVLFADRAELLACAARAACRGLLSAWWWTHLLRDASRAGVVAEWTRAPAYVAAGLEMLASSGDLVGFARTIAPRDAVTLLARTLVHHGLAALARAITEPLPGDELASRAESQGSPGSDPGQIREAPRRRPPWAAIVPEIARATPLEIEQEILAGIVVALRRDPMVVRGEGFACGAAAWRAAARAGRVGPLRAEDGALSSRPAGAVPEDRSQAKRPASADVPAARAAEGTEPSSPGRPRWPGQSNARRSEPARSRQPVVAPPPNGGHPPLSWPAESAAARRPLETRAGAPPSLPSSSALEPQAEGSAPAAVEEAAAEGIPRAVCDRSLASDHAGVFFLLNVASALGLYDPYRGEGLGLDVWDCLALTGRAFVPAIEEDPVWPLLAELARRSEDEPPGARFNPPDDLAFGDWLAALVERVGERLGAALPVDDPGTFLVRRHGRIDVSPAHVDLSFSLAAHPIEIRIAGLDRDPGWIPAAGRHVAFHFE